MTTLSDFQQIELHRELVDEVYGKPELPTELRFVCMNDYHPVEDGEDLFCDLCGNSDPRKFTEELRPI